MYHHILYIGIHIHIESTYSVMVAVVSHKGITRHIT